MIGLIVLSAFVFCVAGIAVRVQLSLFRGFDFTVGTAVLVASEVFVAISGAIGDSRVGIPVASVTGIGSAIAVALAWNTSVDRLAGSAGSIGARVFVASLGLMTATAGGVELLRGPGLVQASAGLSDARILGVSGAVGFGIATLALGLATVIVLTQSRSVVRLEAYAEAPEFAEEIGISRQSLVYVASILTGSLAGLLGIQYAVVEGSRPDFALAPFLYGAAAALLFAQRSIRSAAIGGLVLGSFFAGSQLVVSESMAKLLLFACVAALLTWRGSSRATEAVR